MKEKLPEEILNDLCSRFLINLPKEVKDNVVQLFFYIELAHWHYTDFYYDEDKSLPNLDIKKFALRIFRYLPHLKTHVDNIDQIVAEWKEYKTRVPCHGAILMNDDCTQCILVESYYSRNHWTFPRGKANKGESALNCAIREVEEETGFNFAHLARETDFLEQKDASGRLVRLYLVPGVSKSEDFAPKCRKEVNAVRWFDIDALPVHKADTAAQRKLGMPVKGFFLVFSFVKNLRKWVAGHGDDMLRAAARNHDRHRNTGAVATTTVAMAVPAAAVAMGSGQPLPQQQQLVDSSSLERALLAQHAASSTRPPPPPSKTPPGLPLPSWANPAALTSSTMSATSPRPSATVAMTAAASSSPMAAQGSSRALVPLRTPLLHPQAPSSDMLQTLQLQPQLQNPSYPSPGAWSGPALPTPVFNPVLLSKIMPAITAASMTAANPHAHAMSPQQLLQLAQHQQQAQAQALLQQQQLRIQQKQQQQQRPQQQQQQQLVRHGPSAETRKPYSVVIGQRPQSDSTAVRLSDLTHDLVSQLPPDSVNWVTVQKSPALQGFSFNKSLIMAALDTALPRPSPRSITAASASSATHTGSSGTGQGKAAKTMSSGGGGRQRPHSDTGHGRAPPHRDNHHYVHLHQQQQQQQQHSHATPTATQQRRQPANQSSRTGAGSGAGSGAGGNPAVHRQRLSGQR